METKKCPYCGGEIMLTAKKCKHCGKWLEEREPYSVHENSDTNRSTIDSEVEIKDSATKKIIFCIVGGLILAFVIWMIALSNQKSDWEKAMDEYNNSNSYNTPEFEEVEATPNYSGYQNFDQSTVCPYDGIPDDDLDEYDSYQYRTDSYDSNSDANAWY